MTMSSDDYFTMLVCENGHVITDHLERSRNDARFCDECGAPTIRVCPSCGAKIRGEQINSGAIFIAMTLPAPKYCQECGSPFPWTRAKLDAVKELAELDGSLSCEDAEALVQSAEETMTENPRTRVGALRMKKILKKAGVETTSAVRDLLVDVMAETAKRAIWPP